MRKLHHFTITINFTINTVSGFSDYVTIRTPPVGAAGDGPS